jgi:glycosyltransferase involved in cell wall biosynthesis
MSVFSGVFRRVARASPEGRPGLISVIVTTYDWPEALRSVLYGLANQTDRNFEVVIADDGSDHRTAEVVKASRAPIAGHVWQPHDDFRVAQARNQAILASKGNYCVFLDGDCIPRESYVARHRQLAERGHFVMGNRVMLKKKLTERVLTENLQPEDWSLGVWWIARLAGQVNRLAPLMTLPLGPIRKRAKQTWRAAQACNFAAWRSDIDLIDGFDNIFTGWGWEDNDLILRLMRAGIRRKMGRFATGVIHLWHEPAYAKRNKHLFDETLEAERIRARSGLSAIEHPKLSAA